MFLFIKLGALHLDTHSLLQTRVSFSAARVFGNGPGCLRLHLRGLYVPGHII